MSEATFCRQGPELGASRTRSDDEVLAGHCITCGDDGVEMTVAALDAPAGLATCFDGAGRESTVEIALVAPVLPGDTILVHAGTAIAALGTRA